MSTLGVKRVLKRVPERLSRPAWLALALDTLAKEGKAKLRIDQLCRSLGVTKGSFYWHFTDRDDFVRNLLDYWANDFTARVVERVSRSPGDAKARLFTLMQILHREESAKYDIAMRAWGAQEPSVARAVRKVDQLRFTYVRSLFAEMGFRGRELEMRTRIFVCYHSLEFGLFLKESKEERLKSLKRRHKFFTSP